MFPLFSRLFPILSRLSRSRGVCAWALGRACLQGLRHQLSANEPQDSTFMHPQALIVLTAMAVATVTFFVANIAAAVLPVMLAALAATN
jgi:hypothetical protein